MLNRRAFLSTSAAFSVGSFASMRSRGQSQPLSANLAPSSKYVDVHVPIGTIPVGNDEPPTVDDLLREMDARDMSQACVLPLVLPEAFANAVSTEYVLTETKPHRDRLIPFCVIGPLNSWYGAGESKALRAQLARYRDAGAPGFGEHKPGVAIDDMRSMPLYAACAELKLPVLFYF